METQEIANGQMDTQTDQQIDDQGYNITIWTYKKKKLGKKNAYRPKIISCSVF